jgi:hypothetical protein
MFAARSSVRVVSYVAGMADIGVPGFGVASSTIIGSLVPETSSERETRLRERREFQDARSLEWMRNHRESLSPAMRRRYLRERY